MRGESWQALATAAIVLGASAIPDARRRALVATFGLLLLLVLMLRLPLHLPFAEGDYSDFVHDRSHFNNYMGAEGIQFQYHLSSQTVRGIDALYGETTQSMGEAFHWLSRIIDVILVGGLAALGFSQRWSVRATRYVSLAAAVPTLILFFGYHEFGLLPAGLEAWAIPLALIALERRSWGLYSAAIGSLGVACALHGFGLIGLGVALFVGALVATSLADLGRVAVAGIIGLAGWTGWVVLYLVVLNYTVVAGHADELPLRPLFHAKFYSDYHRTAAPIIHSLHTIGFELLVVVAPCVLLLHWLPPSRLRRAIAIAAIPSIIFVVIYWPVQGLAGDTDFLAAAFPMTFAVAWLASGRMKTTLAMFGLAIVGHIAFAHVLTLGYFHG